MTRDPAEQEAEIADVMGLVLVGRNARVDSLMLAGAPAPVLAGYLAAREALSALGRVLPREAPPPALRDRILGTLGARRAPRRALLVVDMLKDHLTPGAPLEVPRARLIVPALRARLAAARAEGTPVVYVVDTHPPDDSDFEGWGAHNVEGTGGNDVWPEIAPEPGDHVVKKPTYSGFVGSDLAPLLDRLKVDTLVLTGCLTEIGLIATAADALQRGFAVDVPDDSQAGVAEPLEQGALAAMRLMAPYGPARKERLARLAA